MVARSGPAARGAARRGALNERKSKINLHCLRAAAAPELDAHFSLQARQPEIHGDGARSRY